MRRLLFMLFIIGAAPAFADRHGYEEVRELGLPGRGIDTLAIDAGAGSLTVTGVAGLDEIRVTATIRLEENDEDEAREAIEEDLDLRLERDSDIAKLTAFFDSGNWGWGQSRAIDLVVELPDRMHLQVDDGSGPIEISALRGDIFVDDGSGSIELRDSGGAIRIEDGSGGIAVYRAGGDVTIDDGSGYIEVRGAAGSVIIDDGSGGIDVEDVERDLIIVDDGSGSVDYSNIGGTVQIDG